MREIIQQSEWEKLHRAAVQRSGHFLQSWQWGEFQKSLGRTVFRFADPGAIAMVVELPFPFGKKYWYCPKGPIQITDYKLQIVDFLNALTDKAREAGAVFLRVEPPLIFVNEGRRVGSLQPRCTSFITLQKTEEELLAAMHQKTRYNIRVAEKHGVTVERHIDAAPIFDELMGLFSATAKRDKFHLHEAAYYRKQLDTFREPQPVVEGSHPPHLMTFIARHEGTLLAAAIVMFDGDTATYLHGASASEKRNVMAPYALHWAIIQRAKERGYKHYDLWGISTGDEPSWEGITRFKTGFGGETICAPGTFDLIIKPFWHTVYRFAKKFL